MSTPTGERQRIPDTSVKYRIFRYILHVLIFLSVVLRVRPKAHFQKTVNKWIASCIDAEAAAVRSTGNESLVPPMGGRFYHRTGDCDPDEIKFFENYLGMLWENIYLFLGSSLILLGVQVYRSSTVRYYFKFAYFVAHSAFMATVFIPIMLFKPRSWENAILPAAGLRLIKWIFGIELRIRGTENIVHNSGAIVLINHQSILDLLVLAELWKIMDRCTVISKKEVMYFGPFGLASWLWGTIFIDRLNPDQAKGTINRTGETVRQLKSKLLMFPEGTRHGGHELLSFKKGAFHVAVASHVPIQPVVVSRYYFINHKKKIFDRGMYIIDILPAIETDEYIRSTVDGLIDKTYKAMSDGYKQVNREVYAGVKDKCPDRYDWNMDEDEGATRS